tara:strand:- start:722 stop:901 length:180 start_codon:yes stop_codon:yes gene_type:complete
MQSPVRYLSNVRDRLRKQARRKRARRFREQLQYVCQIESLERRDLLTADITALQLVVYI